MVKKYEDYLEELPLMISFSRSGCNWLQAAMEVYFNRHRAGKVKQSPTWMTTPFENPLWCHSHDHGGKLIKTNNKVLYLWRNPVDAIYSLCKLNNTNSEQRIKDWCESYKNLHAKWTKKEYSEKRGTDNILTIRYEDILNDPHGQMKKISEFFNTPFDLERSKAAFELVGGKETVNNKEAPKNDPNLPNAGGKFKHKKSHTNEYAKEREEFRWLWEDYIKKHTNVET